MTTEPAAVVGGFSAKKGAVQIAVSDGHADLAEPAHDPIDASPAALGGPHLVIEKREGPDQLHALTHSDECGEVERHAGEPSVMGPCDASELLIEQTVKTVACLSSPLRSVTGFVTAIRGERPDTFAHVPDTFAGTIRPGTVT